MNYPNREEIKRQIFADPRFYERKYLKVISKLYGVHPNTVHKYRKEERLTRPKETLGGWL